MKGTAKAFVCNIFLHMAKIAICIHRPTIIAITGNVGKTTTKDMIVAILEEHGASVRGSKDSYNSEIGVPLSILGVESGHTNPLRWFFALCAAKWNMLFNIPKFLVLEVGVDKPNDLAYFIKHFSFHRAVITKLSPNPVHAANFPSVEDLYKEKMLLLQALHPDGIGFYREEDSIQREYLPKITNGTLAPISSEALSLQHTDVHYDEHNKPVGTDIVLSFNGKDEPLYIPNILGRGMAEAAEVAVTIVHSLAIGVPISVMRKAIASREPTPGRMRILPGQAGSVIIDDTYNASPVAVKKALEILSMLETKKKVLILGKMAELQDEEMVHKQIGAQAAEIADVVLVYSDIAYGDSETIQSFSDKNALVQAARTHLAPDTVILCKGSQVSRMEQVVKELLSEKVRPEQVLVRQGSHWQ